MASLQRFLAFAARRLQRARRSPIAMISTALVAQSLAFSLVAPIPSPSGIASISRSSALQLFDLSTSDDMADFYYDTTSIGGLIELDDVESALRAELARAKLTIEAQKIYMDRVDVLHTRDARELSVDEDLLRELNLSVEEKSQRIEAQDDEITQLREALSNAIVKIGSLTEEEQQQPGSVSDAVSSRQPSIMS